MVDSANYAINDITPKMVMNFIYKFDETKTSRDNMIMLGLYIIPQLQNGNY